MFDQRWSGRIHLVGNRDSAIYLQWELAACVVLGILLVAVSKLASSRKASGASQSVCNDKGRSESNAPPLL
jgi:hypothetical protein